MKNKMYKKVSFTSNPPPVVDERVVIACLIVYISDGKLLAYTISYSANPLQRDYFCICLFHPLRLRL